MKRRTHLQSPRTLYQRAGLAAWILVATLTAGPLAAHIVPPEQLHPVVASYRRMNFLLQLNPVLWPAVEQEMQVLAGGLGAVAATAAAGYKTAALAQLEPLLTTPALPEPAVRKRAAQELFVLSTRAVVRILRQHLDLAREHLGDHAVASRHLNEARQVWAAFEAEIRATDPAAFQRLGECWLELASALGNPGIYGIGAVSPNPTVFATEAAEVSDYLVASYGDRITVPKIGPLAPIPSHSPTLVADYRVPVRLPPGHNLNKQLPRPRQILNMTTRGVDERETFLIALGDMAFDSAEVFGEPARSLQVACSTCHNKGMTNPNFFIPGLSSRPGNIDVSNGFFAPHANNGLFDPVDIPDLRGIRFTAPYGRNGRVQSLREFTRNVIVSEFNGPEPDPLLLDSLVAYMLEFDFLPNPNLAADGRLSVRASPAAQRGAAIFQRPFVQLGGQSCASCHDPSDHFLDRKRHDIGTVLGAEPDSRDRALDTPTLLSARFTAPYFHDGSQPTLQAVNEWFNTRFALGLSPQEVADLTAYVEAVGDGVEAYEDTVFTLAAELEEFDFFLSTYELLQTRNQPNLIDITFKTVAAEIRAHKWDLQDQRHLPLLDQLAALMDQAGEAHRRGDRAAADAKVAAYRDLYQGNIELLR